MTRRILGDDAGEISDRRLRVQSREDVVAARIPRELIDARVPVVEIAEDDRLRRAGRLARGDDVAVAHVPVLEPRLVLRAADPLYSEVALLHHAHYPHSNVGIE